MLQQLANYKVLVTEMRTEISNARQSEAIAELKRLIEEYKA